MRSSDKTAAGESVDVCGEVLGAELLVVVVASMLLCLEPVYGFLWETLKQGVC
jgi:hypothetical protein